MAAKISLSLRSQRILNRSFMVDWQDRLYTDSVLVRFEDAKLNPKATFTALAAFLDIPGVVDRSRIEAHKLFDAVQLQRGVQLPVFRAICHAFGVGDAEGDAMETGTVYFFTGLSGAGKTTVGGLFHKRLKARKP